jgi:hypothetical protein
MEIGHLSTPYPTEFQPMREHVTQHSANGSTVPVIVVQDELPRHEQVQPVIQLAYRNTRPVNLIILHTAFNFHQILTAFVKAKLQEAKYFISACYSSIKLYDRDTEQSELTAVSIFWTMTATQKLLR